MSRCDILLVSAILAWLASIVVWGNEDTLEITSSSSVTMLDTSTSGPVSGAGWEHGALAADTSADLESTPASFSYTLSPPHTIWGLSVEHFSYIFLIIGGTAPILFIIITIIVMKCYSWRQRQRFDKYATQYRTAQELWELERQEYLNSAGTAEANSGRSPNRVPQRITHNNHNEPSVGSPKSAMINTNSLTPQSLVVVKPAPLHQAHMHAYGNNSGSHQASYLASSSNPNVYFKEGNQGGDQLIMQNGDPNNLVLTVTAFNTSADSSPNLTQITDISQEMGSPQGNHHLNQLHSPISDAPSTQNLGSEEAKALAAFDRIYENLDVSLTTTTSSGDYSSQDAPSYIEAAAICNASSSHRGQVAKGHQGQGHTPRGKNLHTVNIQLAEDMSGDSSRLNPAFSNSSLSDVSSSPQAGRDGSAGINRHAGHQQKSSTDLKQPHQTTFVNSAFVPDCLHES